MIISTAIWHPHMQVVHFSSKVRAALRNYTACPEGV
jgi:hypothetical protein